MQKSNKFEMYTFHLSSVLRKVRKFDRKFRKMGRKEADQEVIKTYLNNSENMNTMEAVLSYDEYLYRRGTRPLVLPDDREVLTKIFKTKVRLNDSAGFRLPFDQFVLAPPKGFELDGIKIPGLLVTFMVAGDREKKLTAAAREIGFDVSMYCDTERSERILSFYYQIQDKEKGLPAMYRTTVPEKLLPAALRCKTHEEFAALIGQIDTWDNYGLDDEESQRQFAIFNLVCKFAIYSYATEDCLTPGLPKGVNQNLTDGIIGSYFGHSVKSGTRRIGNTSEAHYRSAHIRQLSHPRYYKGEHEHKPVGSRFVWVQDTFVGDVDPHTVK